MSENHLTEVLDSTRNRVYSPSTLHRAGRQAHDARGAPERWRRRPGGRGWAAEPRPPGRRLSKKRRAKIIKAPEPQRGPFLCGVNPWFPPEPLLSRGGQLPNGSGLRLVKRPKRACAREEGAARGN